MGKYDKFTNINTEKMLEDYSNSGKQKGKPKTNENLLVLKEDLFWDIRFLPYVHDENGVPFIDGSYHFSVPGQAPFECVYTRNGESCAACLTWMDQDQNGMPREENVFRRDRKTYLPVTVVNITNIKGLSKDKQLSEKELEALKEEFVGKFKFFGISNTLRTELVDKYNIPGYNAFHDIVQGHVCTFKKTAQEGKRYPIITLVNVNQKPCPVFETGDGKPDVERIEKLLDSMPTIYSCTPPIVRQLTAQEISEMMNKVMSNSQKNENGAEAKRGNSKKTEETSQEDIDQTFDNMKERGNNNDVPF